MAYSIHLPTPCAVQAVDNHPMTILDAQLMSFQSQISFFQRLLDPSLADRVQDQNTFLVEHSLQCLTDSVKTARCTLLLGELRNAEIRSTTMLKHTIDVHVEVDWLDVQICTLVSRQEKYELRDSQLHASTRPLMISPLARFSQTTSRKPYLFQSFKTLMISILALFLLICRQTTWLAGLMWKNFANQFWLMTIGFCAAAAAAASTLVAGA